LQSNNVTLKKSQTAYHLQMKAEKLFLSIYQESVSVFYSYSIVSKEDHLRVTVLYCYLMTQISWTW
jgi:hypothetical protein